ncbi:MAG: SpoIID/LytB domain-containing protein [Rhodothermales bacterium]|nr:SpoIID/LytB domain-containing protein [Rhodothermales bacterium]
MRSTSLGSILLLAAVFLTPAVHASPSPGAPDALSGTVRIKLLETISPREASMTAGRYGLAVYQDNRSRPSFQIGPGQRFEISRTGSSVRLRAQGGDLRADHVRLEPLGPGETTVEVGKVRRTYSGSLWLTAPSNESSLEIVNHVPLEDYVAAVVSSEYGLNDLEGSKAMAVVARTYGLRSLVGSTARYDHVDHTGSQVYKGAATVTPLARRAAMATAGEVLTHSGRLIEAVYSSSSGGHTANNEDVWQSNPHPYLRGKQDPWDRVSPNHRWTVEIPVDRLHGALKDALGVDLKSIEIAEKNRDGRAVSIGLNRRTGRSRSIRADEFRRILRESLGQTSLKSTRFDLKQRRGNYVFEGGGFGHGVGMSQYGAHGMAEAGKSYRDIIHFYYTGVALERRQIEGSAPPAAGLLAFQETAPTPRVRAAVPDRLAGRYMPGQPQRPQPTVELSEAVVNEDHITKPDRRSKRKSDSKRKDGPERRRGW